MYFYLYLPFLFVCVFGVFVSVYRVLFGPFLNVEWNTYFSTRGVIYFSGTFTKTLFFVVIGAGLSMRLVQVSFPLCVLRICVKRVSFFFFPVEVSVILFTFNFDVFMVSRCFIRF